jgi:transposase
MNRPRRVNRSLVNFRSTEEHVPVTHPLRPLKSIVALVLDDLGGDLDALFSQLGRPTIAPEKILRARMLQILYSIRDDRSFLEQLGYNLLFRWFVGMTMDDPLWDLESFTDNRDALLSSEVARIFFARVRDAAEHDGLLSDVHFRVDGGLAESWAAV